jgi:glycosyltransferase-like protein
VTDRPLRIALLTYSTRPRGGVVHALELAEALQARGQAVRLFALEKPGRAAFFRPTSVPTSFIPVGDRPGEPMDDKIHRYIDAYVDYLRRELPGEEPYDVYHAEDCISGNALVRLRREGLVPFVVRTVHHVDDFTSPGLISCQHDSIVEPDEILVVSQWWRERLAEDLGVPSRVVHNGVDLARYVPPSSAAARDEIRARLGLDGTVAVLAVGGVEPRKNSIVLLDAFVDVQRRLAAPTGRQPLLVFAGGASLFDHAAYRDAFEARLRRHVADSLLDPASVRRTGPVDDEVLLGLYQAADVLAFPSVREGWGLTVLEAQASGTPVVASDIAVLREYLVDGQNALLVPPDDPDALGGALVRAATDRDLVATLRAGGLATARRFSWASSAERHLELYRELIA